MDSGVLDPRDLAQVRCIPGVLLLVRLRRRQMVQNGNHAIARDFFACKGAKELLSMPWQIKTMDCSGESSRIAMLDIGGS